MSSLKSLEILKKAEDILKEAKATHVLNKVSEDKIVESKKKVVEKTSNEQKEPDVLGELNVKSSSIAENEVHDFLDKNIE